MRKLLVVLVVLAVGVIAFGFYRGWFALSSPEAVAGSHEVNVNLATDTDKMQADVKIVKDKAEELTGNATTGAAEPDEQPADADEAELPAESPTQADSIQAPSNVEE